MFEELFGFLGVGGVGADVGEAFDYAEFVAVVLVLSEVGGAEAAFSKGAQRSKSVAQGKAFPAVLTVKIFGWIDGLRAARVEAVEHR